MCISPLSASLPVTTTQNSKLPNMTNLDPCKKQFADFFLLYVINSLFSTL